MRDERGSQGTELREPSFPWWLRVFVGSVSVAVFGMAALRHAISDPDTFWHIRTGQWLPTTWQFVGPEPWTPASSRPWVLHEWLPELLMGWVESWGGLTGMSWLWATSLVLVGVTLWAICRRRAFTLLAGLVTVTALTAMSASLSLRPHLVTFALAAVFADAWLRTVDDLRPRWWLVPLSWLWACSHGMWFIGPVIGAAALAGGLLDRRVPTARLARLLGLVAATTVAGAVTPLGPRLLLAPFHVGEYTQFVTEWQPMELVTPQMIAFMAMAGAVVLVWGRASRPVPWSQLFLVAVAVGLALLYARTVAVGAAILAPVAASTLQSIVPLRREEVRPRELALLLGTCAVALTATAVVAPANLGEPGRGPEVLADELGQLPAGTVVCNDYDVGGWLLWRLPDLHPVVDGRAEVYSVDHIRASGEFLNGAPGWSDYLTDNGCGAALVADDSPVLEDLVGAGWTKTAEGDGYVLLADE